MRSPRRASRSPFFLPCMLAAVSLACSGGGSSGGGGAAGSQAGTRTAMVAGGIIRAAFTETWPDDSDVSLEEDLVVEGTATLCIEAGSVVTVSDGVKIVVEPGGVLEIKGTADENVVFTTEAGDRWLGIEVQDGGKLQASYALLEHLEGAAVRSSDAAVTIENSVIRDVIAGSPDVFGLWLTGGSVRVVDSSVAGVRAGDGDDGDAGLSGGDGAAGGDGVAGGTLPEDGLPGEDGTDGTAGGDGGAATGIYIGPGTDAELIRNRIEDIRAGGGAGGGDGGSGGEGGSGGSGAELQAGAAGGAGGASGAGGDGGAGGAARGLWLDEAILVALLDQRILDVVGGDGGAGAGAGDGGAGGNGGDGGAQTAAPDEPGAGGGGGDGGDGGTVGNSGAGGASWGVVAVESVSAGGVVQHLIAEVKAGTAGASGAGGTGGAGGNGGAGGDSVTPAIDGAAGGDGGSGGAAGAGGDGNDGGDALALEVAEAPVSELATLNTVADLSSGTGSDGGLAGAAGAAGSGGAAGAGLAPGDANSDGPAGSDGAAGMDATDGVAGSVGAAVGALASAGTDLTVRNTVFALASPAAGIGLIAENGSIDSNFNFFDGVNALSLGPVMSGSRDREEDPELIDPSRGDYRLGPDSPAIDAGDNAFLPAGVDEDLDREPRPVDDPATPDTGEGGGDPVVDVGAFEFQPPSCDTSPDELWPPNHKFVDVDVEVDLGTSATLDPDVSILASSDEPDNDIGDGNTTGDVHGSDGFRNPVDLTDEFDGGDGRYLDGLIELRSERAGPGDGRVYTVMVELVFDENRPRSTICEVHVPHDQGGSP